MRRNSQVNGVLGERLARSIAASTIALGIGVRALHLLSARSLFIDEARVAISIGRLGFTGLAEPLPLEQLATVPFLWAIKAATLVFGMGEVALRLVPFIASAALLPVLWALLRRLTQNRIALLGLLLAAFSPALVRSANEVKPYSVDCLLATATILFGIMLLRGERTKAGYLWFIAAVCLASAISLPAPFYTLPAIVAVGFHASRRDRGSTAIVIAGGALALILWLAGYSSTYAGVAQSEYMLWYWDGAMLRPDAPEAIWRLAYVVGDLTWGGVTGGAILAAMTGSDRVLVWLVVTGAVSLTLLGFAKLVSRMKVDHLVVLIGPNACLATAALVGAYPAAGRLWLFMLPIWLFAATEGYWSLVRQAKLETVARRLLSGCVAVPGILVTLLPSLWPYVHEETRELVRIAESAPKGDAIYVFAGAGPAWLYYSTNWNGSNDIRTQWYLDRLGYGGLAFENRTGYRHVDPELLKWTRSDQIELLGAPTGQSWRPYYGYARDSVARAWPQEEVARILGSGAERAWLLFAHYRGNENRLLDELERSGASELSAERRPGALLISYQLPASRELPVSGDTE